MNNSVMNTQKNQYHHGDLASAFMDAAIRRIAEHGVEKLSLRAVARDLGVSQTAPYRHFQDKTHLLQLLAQQGFEMLADQTKTAANDYEGDLLDKILISGMAYLNFAKHHPEHYRLMFGSKLPRQCQPEVLENSSLSAFGCILDQVTLGVEQGVLVQEEPKVLAKTQWSTVHGIAMLMIDGFYSEYSPQALKQLFTSMLRYSINGIAAEKSNHS